LRDNEVDIDLTSRVEIKGALKYLKNNKATGAQTQWKEKSRKTKIQVGEWGQQQ
jgi:hypothetical protein